MAENQDKNSLEEQDVKRETLTTRQGHPVKDNQNIRTIGNRGPATLENYHFIEKFLISTRRGSGTCSTCARSWSIWVF